MALFPHDKLDWSIRRLEQRLDGSPDDASTRLDYAQHCLSKAWFHDGGEVWFNKALTQARRVLQHDPASPGALVVAGASLVGLDRLEPAQRYLDEALRVAPESATVHLALGAAHDAARRLGAPSGDRHQAVREVEMALIYIGVQADRIGLEPMGEGVSDGDVAVTVRHITAHAAGCPDWSRANLIDLSELNSSNFGCATADNLARMVADPRDLSVGRPTAPASGPHAAGAVARYNADLAAEIDVLVNLEALHSSPFKLKKLRKLQ